MFKTTIQMIGAIVSCLVLLTLLYLIINSYRVATIPLQNFENKVKLNEKVNQEAWNSEKCMNEYDWFLQREEILKARVVQLTNGQVKINQLKEEQARKENLKLDTWQIDEELKQSRSQSLGLNNIYEAEKAEYNAKINNIIKVHCKDLVSRIYIPPSFVF